MIKDISINACLIGLESVLKLDYGQETLTADILKNAIEELENAYGVTLDRSVYDIQAESQLSAQNIDHFLRDLNAALQQMALFTLISFYEKNLPISLADVNYLGKDRAELMLSLKYLMDKEYYAVEHEKIIVTYTALLDSITLHYVKRLFVILIMLDKLGIYEGASIIADVLYMGGLQ